MNNSNNAFDTDMYNEQFNVIDFHNNIIEKTNNDEENIEDKIYNQSGSYYATNEERITQAEVSIRNLERILDYLECQPAEQLANTETETNEEKKISFKKNKREKKKLKKKKEIDCDNFDNDINILKNDTLIDCENNGVQTVLTVAEIVERGNTSAIDLPKLEKELGYEKYKKRYRKVVRSTLYGLIVAAATAILVAMLWLPVLEIYGSSMSPALEEGNVVVSVKNSEFHTKDLVAFYYGNKLLVKRCIAGPSDWVDIDENGEVTVNGQPLDEPYVSEKALGECDLEFPYQVPEEHWFLMGDHRKTSVDSRSKLIGAVSKEQIVGKVIMKIWPLDKIVFY